MLVNSNEGDFVNAYVLLNNQKGGFTGTVTDFGSFATKVILSDFNGDGNLDALILIAFGDDSSALVYLGDGKGGFGPQEPLVYLYLSGADQATVADLNGDGIPDIILQAGAEFGLFLGLGDGTFLTGPVIGTQGAPEGALVVNLHGSGAPYLPDLVVPDTTGGIIVAFAEAPQQ